MFAGSDYNEWPWILKIEPTDFPSLDRMCKRGVVKNDLIHSEQL